jgi:hypothetical protein
MHRPSEVQATRVLSLVSIHTVRQKEKMPNIIKNLNNKIPHVFFFFTLKADNRNSTFVLNDESILHILKIEDMNCFDRITLLQ